MSGELGIRLPPDGMFERSHWRSPAVIDPDLRPGVLLDTVAALYESAAPGVRISVDGVRHNRDQWQGRLLVVYRCAHCRQPLGFIERVRASAPGVLFVSEYEDGRWPAAEGHRSPARSILVRDVLDLQPPSGEDHPPLRVGCRCGLRELDHSAVVDDYRLADRDGAHLPLVRQVDPQRTTVL